MELHVPFPSFRAWSTAMLKTAETLLSIVEREEDAVEEGKQGEVGRTAVGLNGRGY